MKYILIRNLRPDTPDIMWPVDGPMVVQPQISGPALLCIGKNKICEIDKEGERGLIAEIARTFLHSDVHQITLVTSMEEKRKAEQIVKEYGQDALFQEPHEWEGRLL